MRYSVEMYFSSIAPTNLGKFVGHRYITIIVILRGPHQKNAFFEVDISHFKA